VSAKLGYHPVGEAVDESILMRKVITVFSEAKKNLEDGEASCVSFQTRVRALGLGLFKNMTEFIYRTSKLVALSMIPTMLIAVLVFILMLIRP
jgi:predicted neutral ceramidase superfamily lipid hydrolase